MKSNFLCIFVLFLFTQCISQKTKKVFVETTSFENIAQLNGKWYNTIMKIKKKGVSTNIEMQCPAKSFWEISSINGKYTLLKHFATGKSCEIHTIQTNALSFANGNLNYIEGDIGKSETLEKLTNKKFKIIEQIFVNGESQIVENYYEKR